ncbi:hypothetical protein FGO68_gene13197 [Halteria grandinella]|uniref:Uncharacterized protein n=1 Tax=Halteria grandinella TaxID=5974 RepID=A0A8J8NHU8_HALGN|nr:hypothetical protein FGO68_gene13197 [Halteria grandinella]
MFDVVNGSKPLNQFNRGDLLGQLSELKYPNLRSNAQRIWQTLPLLENMTLLKTKDFFDMRCHLSPERFVRHCLQVSQKVSLPVYSFPTKCISMYSAVT